MFNQEIQAYLDQSLIPVRLGCVTKSGWPVVLSLWFLYEKDGLYCASQQASKVVSYLATEPRCAFEVASDQPPYCGIRGQALASIQPELGQEILERLLLRYLGSLDKPLARKLLSHAEAEVAIRLEPVNLFSWNFDRRMKTSLNPTGDKPCPPA